VEIEKTVVVKGENGLHARPAAKFVKKANGFNSTITLMVNDKQGNGKSMIGVLALNARNGSSLVIKATGPDAREAVDILSKYVESGFKEI